MTRHSSASQRQAIIIAEAARAPFPSDAGYSLLPRMPRSLDALLNAGITTAALTYRHVANSTHSPVQKLWMLRTERNDRTAWCRVSFASLLAIKPVGA
jgi:hypothetical protein